MTDNTIPVVDFSPLNISHDSIGNAEEVETVSRVIVSAFSTVGFLYLSNHGLSNSLIDEATSVTGRFFGLSDDIKKNYSRSGDENHGWVSMERESLNPERPGDLKEAFNVTPSNATKWPDEVVPRFSQLSMEIVKQCEKLAARILQAMAIGLDLQDQKYFSDRHNAEVNPSLSTLRFLHYPPMPDNIKPEQIRCGEHSDYGSITLLFQDNLGGLQLFSRTGEWVDAHPIPGTVLVNIGDLMQRWTSDKLISTKHRVVIPKEELTQKRTRRSLAYFVHPDNDVMIKCIDGSDKHEPITALDYCLMRFAATY